MAFQFKSLNRKSASLNNTRRSHLALRMPGNGQPLEATTISFDGSGDSIDDSGSGLGIYPANAILRCTGSNSKNGRSYKASSVASGSIDVLPAMVTTESAGNKILIRSV